MMETTKGPKRKAVPKRKGLPTNSFEFNAWLREVKPGIRPARAGDLLSILLASVNIKTCEVQRWGDGLPWFTQAELGELMGGLSTRQVRRLMRVLEDGDLIYTDETARPDKGRGVNRIWLTPDGRPPADIRGRKRPEVSVRTLRTRPSLRIKKEMSKTPVIETKKLPQKRKSPFRLPETRARELVTSSSNDSSSSNPRKRACTRARTPSLSDHKSHASAPQKQIAPRTSMSGGEGTDDWKRRSGADIRIARDRRRLNGAITPDPDVRAPSQNGRNGPQKRDDDEPDSDHRSHDSEPKNGRARPARVRPQRVIDSDESRRAVMESVAKIDKRYDAMREQLASSRRRAEAANDLAVESARGGGSAGIDVISRSRKLIGSPHRAQSNNHPQITRPTVRSL
jgi:hypothetical protein